MKSVKGISCVFITLMAGMLVLGGCTPQKKLIPPPGPDPVPPDKVPRMYVRPTPQEVPRLSTNVAADISKIAAGTKGVAGAHTVVLGNAAVIGVETDTAWNQGIDLIERTVAKRAEEDPRIVKAYVTGNPDKVARIKEISGKVNDGKPITDYLDEIKSIIKQ